MRIVSASQPFDAEGAQGLFLAGGMGGAFSWREKVINTLTPADYQITVFDPTAPDEVFDDEQLTWEQVSWEHEALFAAIAVMFWFPAESLAPISLLELGAMLQYPVKSLHVGVHPGYARRFEVITQVRLRRPSVMVHDNLDDVITDYVNTLR